MTARRQAERIAPQSIAIASMRSRCAIGLLAGNIGIHAMCPQINDGKYPDPHDVERVPEQAEAQHPSYDHGPEADRARSGASSITSQAIPTVTWVPWVPTKVKNEDRKALRVGPAPRCTMSANSAISSHRNLTPSSRRDQRPEIGQRCRSLLHGDHHHAASETRGQQASRLDEDMALVEQLDSRRAAVGLAAEHRIGREKRGENDDIAQAGTARNRRRPRPVRGAGPRSESGIPLGDLLRCDVDDALMRALARNRCARSCSAIVAIETRAPRARSATRGAGRPRSRRVVRRSPTTRYARSTRNRESP